MNGLKLLSACRRIGLCFVSSTSLVTGMLLWGWVGGVFVFVAALFLKHLEWRGGTNEPRKRNDGSLREFNHWAISTVAFVVALMLLSPLASVNAVVIGLVLFWPVFGLVVYAMS